MFFVWCLFVSEEPSGEYFVIELLSGLFECRSVSVFGCRNERESFV